MLTAALASVFGLLGGDSGPVWTSPALISSQTGRGSPHSSLCSSGWIYTIEVEIPVAPAPGGVPPWGFHCWVMEGP